MTLEDGTERLFRNVGKELPLYAAYYPRRAQILREKMFAGYIINTTYVKLRHNKISSGFTQTPVYFIFILTTFRSIDHHQAIFTKTYKYVACGTNSIHVIWDPIRLTNV